MKGALPVWAANFPHSEIEAIAAEFKLDERWVYAVIMKESSGNNWATRFEEALYTSHMTKYAAGSKTYFINPKGFSRARKITEGTERVHQMTSFGLMQVMGFKARELGYGMDLPAICDVTTGITLGCQALKGFLDEYQGVFRHAAAAYNAGSVRINPTTGKLVNQGYVDQVLLFVSDLGDTEN